MDAGEALTTGFPNHCGIGESRWEIPIVSRRRGGGGRGKAATARERMTAVENENLGEVRRRKRRTRFERSVVHITVE